MIRNTSPQFGAFYMISGFDKTKVEAKEQEIIQAANIPIGTPVMQDTRHPFKPYHTSIVTDDSIPELMRAMGIKGFRVNLSTPKAVERTKQRMMDALAKRYAGAPEEPLQYLGRAVAGLVKAYFGLERPDVHLISAGKKDE